MTASTSLPWAEQALATAKPAVYWLEDADRPQPLPALTHDLRCDLAVVGGGYTGLWTALRAKERNPGREVVVVEATVCGDAASGRNGGFCSASLTHGLGNGLARWPAEMPTLLRLGRENLDGIAATVDAHGIDCGFERTGELDVATQPHLVDELREAAAQARDLGCAVELLDGPAVRAEVSSPTYLSGLFDPDVAMLEPARLAWGLRRVCLELGVRILEHTRVRGVRRERAGLVLDTGGGSVRAGQVAVATNAHPLLRRLRLMTVPVYDYALVTEPLNGDQRASVGWTNRQGVGDATNLFHYYRVTRDDRILWGGYDAIYPFASRAHPRREQHAPTFRTLSGHFFETFPQLEGVRFTHRWGGVIDTSTQFCAFFGKAYGDRLTYAAGFTGLGVGASRFAADTMLDLLSGQPSERTELEMVRRRPLPFPPEPLRYAGIELTRRAMAKADRQQGRRGPWLRTLDRLGLGFDS